MEVGRPRGPGAFGAHERFQEAMLELVRRTRAKVASARAEATREGMEQAQQRQDDAARQTEATSAEARARAAAFRTSSVESQDGDRGAISVERGGDRLDISESSRAALTHLSESTSSSGGADGQRLERLKAQFRSGELNNPERMERAAERMLDKQGPELYAES